MLRALATARKSGLHRLSSLQGSSSSSADAAQAVAHCLDGSRSSSSPGLPRWRHWPSHRRASTGSGSADSSPQPQPASAQGASAQGAAGDTSSIADLQAKLALLEGAGVARSTALRQYTPYLCSPAHHIATRLAFLRARGKLRRPPRLWQVICPSDAELCRLHGEEPAELAAFRRRHLASPEWARFVREHGVQQAQPEPAG